MAFAQFFRHLAPSVHHPRRHRRAAAGVRIDVAEVLECRQLLVAQVTPLSDMNVVAETGGSDPQELTQVGNTLFFTAADKTHGRELWKKEGTSAAVLVKDIFPGTTGSTINELTAVGTTLYFAADDGINGREIWKSDGTPAGTLMVYNTFAETIDPGTSAHPQTFNFSSNPSELVNANGRLFYRANPYIDVNFPALMTTDGTAAGTRQARSDMFVGMPEAWRSNSWLSANGSIVYFQGPNNELWKSDGTNAGTVSLNAPRPLSYLTFTGTTGYFTADGGSGIELWKTDGTVAGTSLVKDIHTSGNSLPDSLTNVNGTLYFSADDGVNGRELWKSDGTAAGTVMVANISAASSSSPGNFAAIGSTVYFSASDGVTGDELWKSDGTAAGTVRVGHGGTSTNFTPRNLTIIGGVLYFSASTAESGGEIWKSDGTTAGTNVFRDLVAGTGGSAPTQLISVNGTLYYSADDGVKGRELWRHDVTTNTATVNDIFRGTMNSSPHSFTAVGSTVFFLADNGTHGEELWKCAANGTGAVMVKDILPGASSSQISGLTSVNGTLYFAASDGTNGRELWKSDGTAAGTVLVKDILAGGDTSQPSGLMNFNGTLLFSATDAGGHELWKSDGTAATTVRVRDITPGTGTSIDRFTNRFVISGSYAYFAADDGTSGMELWKTDGTTAGTVLVRDIRPGTSGSSVSELTDVAGLLYFVADNGTNGVELWQSNGNGAGTSMVADLNLIGIDQLTNVSGKLFFSANGELWSRNTSSATPTLLKEIGEGSWSGAPLSLTAVGSTLFFTAVYATQTPYVGLGRELWKSDGTTAGTGLVRDIVNVPVSWSTSTTWGSNPLNLVNNNGTLFFTANDMVNGQDMWMSDGTEAGTKLFADLTGDAGSSHPENLTVINGRIFASVMSETIGREAVSVVDVVVPATPTILLPGTAKTTLQRPIITWTPSNGAVSYTLQIKNNSTGVATQVLVSVTDTTYTPTADLGIGQFTIWVQAVNAAGTKSAWSAGKNVTIHTPVTTAPMIRNQTTSRPTVVWNDLPGAVKYDVWLENATPNETSTVILHDVKGKSWQNPTNLPLGQYKVYVRGLDASGLAAAWSMLVAFNVATPPAVIGPVDSVFAARPQFTWTSVPGATKYEVYLKNLNTETVVVHQTSISATNWIPTGDLPKGHYRWQVVAASTNYRSLWSKETDFSVGGRPELTGPAASGSDTTPTFTWKVVAGAASYQIWVDRADTYVQGVINISGLTGTSWTPTTPLPLGTFRVWIRAVSTTGVLSDWSEHRSFVIQ